MLYYKTLEVDQRCVLPTSFIAHIKIEVSYPVTLPTYGCKEHKISASDWPCWPTLEQHVCGEHWMTFATVLPYSYDEVFPKSFPPSEESSLGQCRPQEQPNEQTIRGLRKNSFENKTNICSLATSCSQRSNWKTYKPLNTTFFIQLWCFLRTFQELAIPLVFHPTQSPVFSGFEGTVCQASKCILNFFIKIC